MMDDLEQSIPGKKSEEKEENEEGEGWINVEKGEHTDLAFYTDPTESRQCDSWLWNQTKS